MSWTQQNRFEPECNEAGDVPFPKSKVPLKVSTFNFQVLLLPSPITVDTKNRLILLICLYKTSDEVVYRKAKNA